MADKQAILIISLRQLLEPLLEEVVNFLKENTILDQFLKMDFGTARLIKQFMNERLKSMCKKAQPGKVSCPFSP